MTDMLRIAEEAAEQAKFSLVSIDLNTCLLYTSDAADE